MKVTNLAGESGRSNTQTDKKEKERYKIEDDYVKHIKTNPFPTVELERRKKLALSKGRG